MKRRGNRPYNPNRSCSNQCTAVDVVDDTTLVIIKTHRHEVCATRRKKVLYVWVKERKAERGKF